MHHKNILKNLLHDSKRLWQEIYSQQSNKLPIRFILFVSEISTIQTIKRCLEDTGLRFHFFTTRLTGIYNFLTRFYVLLIFDHLLESSLLYGSIKIPPTETSCTLVKLPINLMLPRLFEEVHIESNSTQCIYYS